MIIRRLGLINRNQRGITIVEWVIAFGLSSIIAAAATATTFQVIEESARTNNHMTAVRQVQSAGYWVSRDAQMAQSVSWNTTAPDGFPLTLTWTAWDGIEYEVIYSSEDMTTGSLKYLQRSYSADGTPVDNTYVAQCIDLATTSANYTDGELIFTVTATVGAGSQAESETRVYKIAPRPGL